MTCPRFSLFLLIWLFLLSIHLIRGRESLIATHKNTSILRVNIPAQTIPQMTSKVDATEQNIINHWAVVRFIRGEYYGVQASINVYGLPTIKSNQASAVRIWVTNKSIWNLGSYNAIQAGWEIAPDKYGDHDTHFYVIWTVDENYKTGCANFGCKGFVLHNASKLVPGYRLQPLSEYNGVQRFITLKISKDRATGDWWLYYGTDGTKPVGYWPKSLFSSLANSATTVQIGGVTTFVKGGISPPMGSGHDAIEGEGRAASIKNTRLIDENGYLHIPSMSGCNYHSDSCYKIVGEVADTVYIGGPGGCKD